MGHNPTILGIRGRHKPTNDLRGFHAVKKIFLFIQTVLIWLAVSFPAAAAGSHCAAVHEAAFLGEPAELAEILRHGADANCLDEAGQTPLITAVDGGSLSCVAILLLAGVDVNVRDQLSETALTRAITKQGLFDRPRGEKYRLIFQGIAQLIELAGGTP